MNESLNYPKLYRNFGAIAATTVIGFILLIFAGHRIGDHKSSTYGRAYEKFARSWGGEVSVKPLVFSIVAARFSDKNKRDLVNSDTVDLVPSVIELDNKITYEKQEEDWLTFNAYTISSSDKYKIINTTRDTGALRVVFERPFNAVVLYDLTLWVNGKKIRNFEFEKPFIIDEDFSPEDSADIKVTYTTRGQNQFLYTIGSYRSKVTDKLKAVFTLNSKDFQMTNKGVPFKVTGKDRSTVVYDISDFSAGQDLGISFSRRIQHLDKIETLLKYSPVALVLFLLLIFVTVQLHSKSIAVLNYIVAGFILVFYYLFIAYLIRFLNITATIGLSFGMTAVLSYAYFNVIFGKSFFLSALLPYITLFTIVFSLIFMFPVLQGILFITFIFALFIHLIMKIAKTRPADWSIFRA